MLVNLSMCIQRMLQSDHVSPCYFIPWCRKLVIFSFPCRCPSRRHIHARTPSLTLNTPACLMHHLPLQMEYCLTVQLSLAGIIRVGSPLDYEKTSYYELLIEALDTTTGNTAHVSVYINVTVSVFPWFRLYFCCLLLHTGCCWNIWKLYLEKKIKTISSCKKINKKVFSLFSRQWNWTTVKEFYSK